MPCKAPRVEENPPISAAHFLPVQCTTATLQLCMINRRLNDDTWTTDINASYTYVGLVFNYMRPDVQHQAR